MVRLPAAWALADQGGQQPSTAAPGTTPLVLMQSLPCAALSVLKAARSSQA